MRNLFILFVVAIFPLVAKCSQGIHETEPRGLSLANAEHSDSICGYVFRLVDYLAERNCVDSAKVSFVVSPWSLGLVMSMNEDLCGTDILPDSINYVPVKGCSTKVLISEIVEFPEDVAEKWRNMYGAEVIEDAVPSDFSKLWEHFASSMAPGLCSSPMDIGDGSSTALSIANSISMEEDWGVSFMELKWFRFFDSKGREMKLRFGMEALLKTSYWSDGSCAAVKVPLKAESGMDFVVVLPKGGMLDSSLSCAGLERAFSGLMNSENSTLVRLRMPQFRISFSADLKIALEDSGIADLSALSFILPQKEKSVDKNPAKISRLFQNADISVSDKGIKATATTLEDIEYEFDDAPGTEPKFVWFNAYRPFYFFVVDRSSGAILFAGAYTGI